MTREEMSALPRTREEAKEAGSKHYFTGKSCKQGHQSHRYTHDAHCVECHEVSYSSYVKSGKLNSTRARFRERNLEEVRLRRAEEGRKRNSAISAHREAMRALEREAAEAEARAEHERRMAEWRSKQPKE